MYIYSFIHTHAHLQSHSYTFTLITDCVSLPLWHQLTDYCTLLLRHFIPFPSVNIRCLEKNPTKSQAVTRNSHRHEKCCKAHNITVSTFATAHDEDRKRTERNSISKATPSYNQYVFTRWPTNQYSLVFSQCNDGTLTTLLIVKRYDSLPWERKKL